MNLRPKSSVFGLVGEWIIHMGLLDSFCLQPSCICSTWIHSPMELIWLVTHDVHLIGQEGCKQAKKQVVSLTSPSLQREHKLIWRLDERVSGIMSLWCKLNTTSTVVALMISLSSSLSFFPNFSNVPSYSLKCRWKNLVRGDEQGRNKETKRERRRRIWGRRFS